MKGRRFAVGVLALLMLVALVLGLAACGGSDSGDTASSGGSDANAAPVMGGTLTVTFQGEPTELDPGDRLGGHLLGHRAPAPTKGSSATCRRPGEAWLSARAGTRHRGPQRGERRHLR